MTTVRGFIMMTALPPTLGHAYLIEWARTFCYQVGIRHLTVMVCAKPAEPLPVEDRIQAFKDYFTTSNGVYLDFIPLTKEMPDQPEDHENFWAKWTQQVDIRARVRPGDYIFASEAYGAQLAQALAGTFIQCDIWRELVPAKASYFRQNGLDQETWLQLLPTLRSTYRKKVTVFGAESTGKTTLSQHLCGSMHWQYVHEWARPYLESLPTPETTEQRMLDIIHGQYAAETAIERITDKPVIVKDTDLISSIGFQRAYNLKKHPVPFIKSDLYLLTQSNIPFTPDPLRYGGDVRETTDEYWEAMLDEFGCTYYKVRSKQPQERYEEAKEQILALFFSDPLFSYQR